jgi:hypothetical protein
MKRFLTLILLAGALLALPAIASTNVVGIRTNAGPTLNTNSVGVRTNSSTSQSTNVAGIRTNGVPVASTNPPAPVQIPSSGVSGLAVTNMAMSLYGSSWTTNVLHDTNVIYISGAGVGTNGTYTWSAAQHAWALSSNTAVYLDTDDGVLALTNASGPVGYLYSEDDDNTTTDILVASSLTDADASPIGGTSARCGTNYVVHAVLGRASLPALVVDDVPQLPGSKVASVAASQITGWALTVTNMAPDYAIRLACAQSDSINHHGRFGWTNTLAALRRTNGPPFRVEFTGDGWCEDSVYGGFATNLIATFGFCGNDRMSLGGFIGFYNYGNDAGINQHLNDAVWHGSICDLTNAGAFVTHSYVHQCATNVAGYSNFAPNVLSVSYIIAPTNGSFKLQYATNGHGLSWWDTTFYDVPGGTISSWGLAYTGAVTYITQQLACAASVRVVSLGATNVTILGVGEYDMTKAGVIVSAQYAHQGTGPAAYVQADPRVTMPIFRGWSPTLVFFEDEEAQDPFYAWAVTNIPPTADIVVTSIHEAPLPAFASLGPIADRNSAMAWTNRVPFFNGHAAIHSAWGSYSNGIVFGWATSNAIPHLTDAGYAAYGQLMWYWMGLANYSPTVLH